MLKKPSPLGRAVNVCDGSSENRLYASELKMGVSYFGCRFAEDYLHMTDNEALFGTPGKVIGTKILVK